MADSKTDGLVRRLERVERINRGLAVCGLAAVILLVAGGASSRSPSHLEVTRLSVVDASGQVRASLTLDGSGLPSLVLTDAAGKSRVAMVVGESESGVLLTDPAGTARAMLTVGESGHPTLVLADKIGTTRADLGLREEVGPSLTLRDPSGEARAVLNVPTVARPGLVLNDAHSDARTVVGVARNRPTIQLINAEGELVKSLP